MSTVWPRCRSGAVGSNPALMRKGTAGCAGLLQALAQRGQRNDFRRAFLQIFQLLFYRGEI